MEMDYSSDFNHAQAQVRPETNFDEVYAEMPSFQFAASTAPGKANTDLHPRNKSEGPICGSNAAYALGAGTFGGAGLSAMSWGLDKTYLNNPSMRPAMEWWTGSKMRKELLPIEKELAGKKLDLRMIDSQIGKLGQAPVAEGAACEATEMSKLIAKINQDGKFITPEAKAAASRLGQLTPAELAACRTSANEGVLAAESAFAAQLEKGCGSGLMRALSGSGRGLLVAAGLVAVGYGFEWCKNAFAPKTEEASTAKRPAF